MIFVGVIYSFIWIFISIFRSHEKLPKSYPNLSVIDALFVVFFNIRPSPAPDGCF